MYRIKFHPFFLVVVLFIIMMMSSKSKGQDTLDLKDSLTILIEEREQTESSVDIYTDSIESMTFKTRAQHQSALRELNELKVIAAQANLNYYRFAIRVFNDDLEAVALFGSELWRAKKERDRCQGLVYKNTPSQTFSVLN